MKKRRPNYRRVKIHRSYTVEDVARLFCIHKNTVRAWVKAGLKTCDDRRPILILGRDIASFLQSRRASKKCRCGPCELYCLRCRAPKTPAGGMVDYEPTSETLGNLKAICPQCYAVMNRRTSLVKLGRFKAAFEITFSQEVRRLTECPRSSVNSDFGEEA